MGAARATVRRIVRPGGRRLHLPVAKSLTAAKKMPSGLNARSHGLRPPEPVEFRADAEARWPVPARARRSWAGLLLSWVLHGGTALTASLLLIPVQDGIPPGSPEPIEVEIISADAFDSAFAESGASPATQAETQPAEEPLPEIPLPPELPPLADTELLPVPDIPPVPPVPDPVEALAREVTPPEPVEEARSVPPDAEAIPQATPEEKPEEKPQEDKQEAKAEPEKPVAEVQPPKPPAPPPPKPPERKVAPKPPAKKVAAKTPPRPTAPGRGEAGKGQDSTSALSAARGSQGRSGAAGSGFTSSFRSRVMAHLARYKRYPEAARRQQLQGRVLVTFSFDASGRVTGVNLAGSSGHGLLDAEALAWVRRASPFPAIPPESGQTIANFTAPLVFDLN